MLIPDKSTGEVYTAPEFTPFKNETQNAIISGGEPLDASDSSQLSKRITLAASQDDFYTSTYDTSTATYQLTGPAIRAYPFEYKIGMRIRFIVDTENDASATYIKLGSLDSLRVSTTRLANGETPVFSTGYFLQYEFAELIYEQTPDGLTEYWLTSKMKLSEITDGNLSITRDVSGDDLELKVSPANIIMDNTSDSSLSYIQLDPNKIGQRYHSNFIDIISGVMSLYNLSGTYQSDLSEQVLTIGNGSTPTDYVRIRAESSGGSYIQTVNGPTGLDTYVTGKGVKYTGEGVNTNKEHRPKCLDLSGLAISTPTNPQVGYRVFPGGTDTGLVAADTVIRGATIRYLDINDRYVVSSINLDSSINASLNWSVSIGIPVDVNTIDAAKVSGGFVVDMVVWLDYYFV